jgi:cbb3-type cytochrome oxidase subunit 3
MEIGPNLAHVLAVAMTIVMVCVVWWLFLR